MKKVFYLLLSWLSLTMAKAQVSSVTVNLQTTGVTDTLIQPNMLGVISGPNPWNPNHPNASWVTNQLQDVGVNTIRNNDYQDDRLDMEQIFYCGSYPINIATPKYPDWSCNAANTSSYNWVLSDQQMLIYQNSHFMPLLRIGNEYSNIFRAHDYNGPRANEENNWIKAATKMALRYSYFNGDSNALGGYLNLWTEWPNTTFWDRTDAEFNSFWRRCYDSLKTACPTLKIGGPGFHPAITSKLAQGQASPRLLSFLMELKNNNIRPDWLGFHVFSNDLEDYYTVATNLRHYLHATGPYSSLSSNFGGSGTNSYFYDVPIMCDAWDGSEVENGISLSNAQIDSVFNKKKGGALTMGAFIIFQQTDVVRAYKYRANDPEANPNAGPANNYTGLGKSGIFFGDSANTYKPQAYAFKLCKQIQNNYTGKITSPVFATTSLGGKVWTLAAKNANNEIAILVSNYTPETVSMDLKINNTPLVSGQYTYVNHYQVTDTDHGEVPQAWTGGAFMLPPYTAHLITLKNTTTGLNDALAKAIIPLMYPNPTNGLVHFSAQITAGVYNMAGQRIAGVTNADAINLSWLGAGLYFIRICDTEGNYLCTQKLVKE